MITAKLTGFQSMSPAQPVLQSGSQPHRSSQLRLPAWSRRDADEETWSTHSSYRYRSTHRRSRPLFHLCRGASRRSSDESVRARRSYGCGGDVLRAPDSALAKVCSHALGNRARSVDATDGEGARLSLPRALCFGVIGDSIRRTPGSDFGGGSGEGLRAAPGARYASMTTVNIRPARRKKGAGEYRRRPLNI
jgi:hypothetical protein